MATFAKPGTTSIPAEEVKSDKDACLPSKRKPDVTSVEKDDIQEEGNDASKKKKPGIPAIDDDSVLPDIEEEKDVSEAENDGIQADNEVDGDEEHKDEEYYEGEDDDEEDEDEDEDDDDGDEYDDDEDDEESNGDAQLIDHKGKGIMKDEKGKGKLIEEFEDSSDCGTESGADTDLSDDPLAEVDLDNILPSRTRRRTTVQSGLHISDDQGKKEDKDVDSSS